MSRKPDYEVTLDQQQLSMAAGNYCADVLKALPAGVYAQSQLSITTNPERGELTAVFRAWGPVAPVQPRQALVVGMSGPSQEPVTATTPEQVRDLFGYPVPLLGEPARPFRPVSCGYEPTEETDEP